MRRLLLALGGALTGALPGCAAVPAALPGPASAFRLHPLPGADGAVLQALLRSERAAPLRYRVIVLPGSGCAGLGAFAGRYFAGLLHAQVLVLHKPGVAPQARTAAADCAPDLVRQDRLSVWQAHGPRAPRAQALESLGEPPVPPVLRRVSLN